jgi:endo-1,4-beta-xylanase
MPSNAALLLCLLVGALLPAVETTPLPDGGRLLVRGEAASLGFRQSGERGSSSVVAVDGGPSAQVLRVAISTPGQPWDAEVKLPVPAAIAKDETLLVRIWVRAVRSRAESGDVSLTLNLQQSGPPWGKTLSHGITASSAWREVLVPFTSRMDLAAGGAQIAMHVGDREQELELGPIELWSYGTTFRPNDLPRSRTTWAGMEADAPWRAEADQRIETFRKGDLALRVLDAAGKPVAGSPVHVRMIRHAFPFGTAAVGARIMGTKPEDEVYRTHLSELFNAVVLENDLKWGPVEQPERRVQTLAALRWLQERKFLVRGHVMVWPSWRNQPKYLKDLAGDPTALRKRILDHIDDVTGITSGLVAHWDVINEPYDNHDITDVCGREEMVAWFRRARERLPVDCRLFLNDYGIVAAGGATDTPHQKHYLDTIRFLQEQGAPLEGLGVQSHFGSQPTPPLIAIRILDSLAAAKLPIVITEFDINTQDEDYQAAYTRDYLTLCFAHPAVAGFLMWGFWEGAHWLPQAAMLRKDWSARPNLAVWRELVQQRWWTDATVTTDADGRASLRGFKGDYEITSGAATAPATIGDAAATVELRLP